MKFRTIIVIIAISFIFPLKAYTWSDKVTHKDLSQIASETSIIGASDYLKNIGLKEGLLYLLKLNAKEQEVHKWLQEGGELEDSGSNWDLLIKTHRSYNHFHNPLKPWESAGLDDLISIPPYLTTGASSLLWAQDGSKQASAPEGNRTWNKTRECFFIALTGRDFAGQIVAPDKKRRDEQFAKMFLGLGHQMHLIQDAAVPDHVRNDAHPEDSVYSKMKSNIFLESWTAARANFINNLASNPVLPTVSHDPAAYILDESYNNRQLAPSALFIDTDQYRNTNPGQFFSSNLATSLVIGLAEYTNANFFSEDTTFASERYAQDHKHYFPYPNVSDTDIQEYIAGTKPIETVTAADSTQVTGVWISKNKNSDPAHGESILHFIKPSPLLTMRVYNQFGESDLFYKTFFRDEICHKDYVEKLIPRAVGYSAGLLNYFFRGSIEISPPDNAVYAITDGSILPQSFTYIKAKVRNTTPLEVDTNGNPLSYESMQSGILHAVARYKIVPDYYPNLWNYPPDRVNMQNKAYSYSVSAPVSIASLNSTVPTEFVFDFAGNEIPANITDLSLQVIFKGTLGNEKDIAVAVGMKDLLEPTHHVFWNLSDMININGKLYTKSQLFENKNKKLLAMVDKDGDGIFNEPGEPSLEDDVYFEISYLDESPTSNPVYHSAALFLAPGRHARLIILSEKAYTDSNQTVLKVHFVRTSWSDNDNTAKYDESPFQGALYEDANPDWQQPAPVINFRVGTDGNPIMQHYQFGVLSCIPGAVQGICPYPEEQSVPADPNPVSVLNIFQ